MITEENTKIVDNDTKKSTNNMEQTQCQAIEEQRHSAENEEEKKNTI